VVIPGRLAGAGANGPPAATAALKPASELKESLLELPAVENSEFDANKQEQLSINRRRSSKEWSLIMY
jgi:hypothetical protein